MTLLTRSARGFGVVARGLSSALVTVVGAVVTGAAVMVVVLLAAVAVTLTTGTAVHLPGVLRTWLSTENGAPAVLFEPDGTGAAVAVLVVAAVLVAVGQLWTRRSRARTSARARAAA
jgi:hypothetical protein